MLTEIEIKNINHLGIVAGIILSGLSVSPIYLGNVFLKMMNPNNEPPTIVVQNGDSVQKYFDWDIVQHFPQVARVFSGILICTMLLGVALIWEPLKKEDLLQMNSQSMIELGKEIPERQQYDAKTLVMLARDVMSIRLLCFMFSVALGMQFISYVQYQFKVFY